MGKSATQGDDEQLLLRIQVPVGDVVSPELYADLSATKVKSRRHRLIHLATLGLLLERSLLNGGLGSTVANAPAVAPERVAATPSTPRRNKQTSQSQPAPSTTSEERLEVPPDFGSLLVDELST